MGRIVSLVLCLWALGALAQAESWQSQNSSSAAAISASLASSDGQIRLLCGRVLNDDTALAEDIGNSGFGFVNFVVSESVLGPYDAARDGLTSVSVSYAGGEIPLPVFYFDVMGAEGWVSRLPVDHPFLLEIGYGGDFTLKAPGIADYVMNRSGLSVGLLDMLDHCAPSEQESMALRQTLPFAAQAHQSLSALCRGDYSIDDSAFRVADVTGDGVDDLLLDYTSLDCTTGLLSGKNNPTCADAMCRHDVFSSEAAQPVVLYAFTIGVVDETPGDLSLGMDPDSCASMGQPAGCRARMRWMNGNFATIGMEGP